MIDCEKNITSRYQKVDKVGRFRDSRANGQPRRCILIHRLNGLSMLRLKQIQLLIKTNIIR